MPPMSPAPAPAKSGVGLRLGEGDDNGRSRDEVRIIKEMLAEEIQRFIIDNRIDGPAARDLRVEPVHVQFAVLDRGPLTSCVNPSGALIGRIRDAKKGIRHGAGGGPPTQIHQPLQLPTNQQTLAPGAGTPNPGMPPPLSSLPGAPAGPLPGGNANDSLPGVDLERFAIENRLDAGAVMSLRAENREVQEKVISMGPLVNATNPSAALMGRIRTQRTNVMAAARGVPGAFGGGPTPGLPPMPSPPMTAPPMAPQLALPAMAPPATAPPGHDMNAEAMKAIQAFGSRGSTGPAGDGATAQAQPDGGSKLPSGASVEDSRLQEEALKAIQAINYGDL